MHTANNRQSMNRVVCLSLFALVACRDATGKQQPETKKQAPVQQPAPAEPQPANAAVAGPKPDGKKGDKDDSEWVPAEFKQGMARWKDTGVYLDGKPIGFLAFGELPITLKPTWVKDK